MHACKPAPGRIDKGVLNFSCFLAQRYHLAAAAVVVVACEGSL